MRCYPRDGEPCIDDVCHSMNDCAWPPPAKLTTGQAIRQERIDKGGDGYMTIRQLAAAAGLTAPRLSKIEAGREHATDDELQAIYRSLANRSNQPKDANGNS